MDNKFCGYCRYYQHEKNGRYICRNRKSGGFNTNPAPFQGCRCFSENVREKTAERENKKEIVRCLGKLLVMTRAGENISDLVLSKGQDTVTIFFKNGCTKKVNIEADSGIAVIRDVISSL